MLVQALINPNAHAKFTCTLLLLRKPLMITLMIVARVNALSTTSWPLPCQRRPSCHLTRSCRRAWHSNTPLTTRLVKSGKSDPLVIVLTDPLLAISISAASANEVPLSLEGSQGLDILSNICFRDQSQGIHGRRNRYGCTMTDNLAQVDVTEYEALWLGSIDA